MKTISAVASVALLASQALANLEPPQCIVRTVYTTVTVLDESGSLATVPTSYDHEYDWANGTPVSKSLYGGKLSSIIANADVTSLKPYYGHEKPSGKPWAGDGDEDESGAMPTWSHGQEKPSGKPWGGDGDDKESSASWSRGHGKPTGKPWGGDDDEEDTGVTSNSRGHGKPTGSRSKDNSYSLPTVTKSPYGSLSKSPSKSTSTVSKPSSSAGEWEWTGEWDVECDDASSSKAQMKAAPTSGHAKGYAGAYGAAKRL